MLVGVGYFVAVVDYKLVSHSGDSCAWRDVKVDFLLQLIVPRIEHQGLFP